MTALTISDLRAYAESVRDDWCFEHHGQECPLDVDRWVRDAGRRQADINEMLFEAHVTAHANRWA